ncbi:hypothetical protein GO289_03833 [Ralstonia solanacearum]|nr:hypothetical protein [Ralstonia solanacearum]
MSTSAQTAAPARAGARPAGGGGGARGGGGGGGGGPPPPRASCRIQASTIMRLRISRCSAWQKCVQ